MTFFYRFSIALWVTSMLIACNDVTQANAAPNNAPQAIAVDVATVISEEMANWDTFSGRLQAPQTVELRPRVSGYIDMVAFEEGQHVKQGQTLFLIDNRALKAEADRLTAQLAQAESRLQLAKQDLGRAEKLKETQAISAELVDNRRAEVVQAQANVAAISAQLKAAKLERGFARVEAPISGRISRANITAGNYVTAGESVLTTIVSTDKLHAYFDIDEQTYLNYASQYAGSAEAISQLPVAMRLANEEDFVHWGRLDFIDNQVNVQSGTLRVRAVFNNPDSKLLPGLFAHLKLASGKREQQILIDEKSIGTDLNTKFVLVLTQDNKLAYRAVKLGDKIDSLRYIEEGLNPGETIVVNGLQRVRPGAVVQPTIVDMAPSATLNKLHAWQQQVQERTELAATSVMNAGRGTK